MFIKQNAHSNAQNTLTQDCRRVSEAEVLQIKTQVYLQRLQPHRGFLQQPQSVLSENQAHRPMAQTSVQLALILLHLLYLDLKQHSSINFATKNQNGTAGENKIESCNL